MYPKYNQLEISEPIENVFVGEMKINGRKSFNLNFIDDLTDFFMFVYNKKNINEENRFFVFKGEEGTGVFNFGGDLSLFLELINKKDIYLLQMYGRKCIDLIYRSLNAKKDNMTTVAIINGDAKGGGFESSLACDIIIAEKGYTIQLPEIKWGFFPGMGAFELLTKRIGIKKTKEFILSGSTLTTEELYELGVFDYLVDKGTSCSKLKEIVEKERAMQVTFNSIREINDRITSVTYDDLIKTVDLWAKSIVELSEENKKKIKTLIRAQERQSKRVT